MDARDGGAPLHLEVRHLRLVAAIAETGSVTRTARRMVTTPAGERLLATARRVLADLAAAERDLGAAAADAGVARVATECYTCYHWLPGVLREFRERWPRVE